MRKLQKIVTRFYYPITVKSWSLGAIEEMKKLIGIGFSDMILKFDGKTVENYRFSDEVERRIKPAMLAFVQSKGFFNGIQKYEKLVAEFDRTLKEGKDMKKAVKLSSKVYPLMGVSYFVSNIFPGDLPASKKDKILELCMKYRIASNGYMNRLDQFAYDHLTEREVSPFTPLELVGKKPGNVWLEHGFIMSKGKFLKPDWKGFLKKNDYFYEEERVTGNLTGNAAFLGKVRGKAKLIFSPKDMPKVDIGDILVAPMTQPIFSPILTKVAAIITDEGGITCHAAIISRELKIPCITGTKFATKVLKDGDLIEVDANKGIVRKLFSYGQITKTKKPRGSKIN